MATRTDVAVVLARGASSRMGRPKGLCRRAGQARTFLQEVADLYATAGLPVAVVTTPQLVAPYAALFPPKAAPRWIAREAGGGTALSVAAALTELAAAATHLWLHPVDLPRVRPATLAALRAASLAEPDAVIVPACEGVPGHPVVLPCAPFSDLRGAAPAGGMRALLLARARGEGGHALRLLTLAVADPGVIADLDTPTDAAGEGPAAEEDA